jgi:hypothetical protein
VVSLLGVGPRSDVGVGHEGRLGLLVVHVDVHGEAAVLSHQRPLRLEGDHLAVGAERGVQAAELEVGLGAVGANA